MDSAEPLLKQPPTLLPAYGFTAVHMKPFLSTHDCPNPLGANPFTFPNTTTSGTAAQAFPRMLPAPSHLRPRHADHQEQLSKLDVDYGLSDHDNIRDMKILDVNRLIEDANGKMALKEAADKLEEHYRERMGFVQVASERLQAATGMRNDYSFVLPDLKTPTLSSTFRAISPHQQLSEQDAINSSGTSYPFGIENFGPKFRPTGEIRGFRRDSGVALHRQMVMNALNPVEVDPGTGKGLREWLMMNGKKFGMQKRECSSISLHDFTPNPKTGAFANVLLGHYSKDGVGERIDVYETDIPVTYKDEETGMTRSVLDTWVWFLISRPVVSISENDTSTLFQDQESARNYGDGDSSPHYTQFAAPMSGPNKQNNGSCIPTTQGTPPPNFPRPIPNSFIVFACPITNLTEYEELTEHISHSKSTMPSAKNRNTLPWVSQSATTKIHKRKDYDLSHQGIPLFEFNGAAGIFGPGSIEQFLSVEALGSWYNSDPYQLRSVEENQRMHMDWANDIGPDALETVDDLAEKGQQRKIRNLLDEPPAPYMGAWWAAFYKGVWEDCERWRAVRRAMGMGKLRVVTRWVEVEKGESIDPLPQGKDDEMLDVGAELVSGGEKDCI